MPPKILMLDSHTSNKIQYKRLDDQTLCIYFPVAALL